ncbi:amidohydrolase/deacetylase family metallohydrolase [Companilactobacillus futsaii]|uniref:Amidohydrolase/deacetylase family metallohydrolase n=2 Tax=Companilactobacillus futsaii TaxID=938155 RepID=A0A5B7T5V3_9LACO|nr:amidohydrolase/deacetylase family metallohydrolase [Companilactobacillus futsaii]KRK95568.1 dihydroorotase [Companilactobacillus futsaii JCM 17355]QCX25782.1 amidohydrolase/deacetylase family metallohydrolase [Companilactobacillus futsaii]
MTSLYIKNGKDVSGFPLEILIEDRKIAQIGPKLSVITADYEIDLHNASYVSAGWIDDHVHCYEKLSLYYDDPDKVGYLTGVTTVIDAGSTGADNIEDFYQITRQKKTNVFAMINISRTGILAQNELADMTKIEYAPLQKMIDQFPEFIVGIKARISKSVVVDNGIKPLIKAKLFQKLLTQDLPLMVHVGTNPPMLSEIMDVLEKGDIITHCFNGKDNGILNSNGQVEEFVKAGLAKGIIFDIGHGSESFNIKTAQQATAENIFAQSLSTDIYHHNREHGPVYNMATCIEKMLYLGFELKQIIPMITTVPAHNFNLDKGELSVGKDADLTIFDVKNQTKTLTDSDGNKFQTNTVVEPIYSIIGGQSYAIGENDGSI